MRKRSFAFAATLATIIFFVAHVNADTVTFDIYATEQVTQGELVFWTIFVTVSDIENDNFGIDTVTTDLTDSGGHALPTGTISTPFDDYTFKSGGTPDGSSLLEIGATLLAQSSAAEGAFGGFLGPIELASGSFVATNLGTHDLTLIAGTANRYFTAAGQGTGGGNAFEEAIFNGDTYTVLAVPEPISTMPLLSLVVLCLLKRKRT
jgi:hypothetical protein